MQFEGQIVEQIGNGPRLLGQASLGWVDAAERGYRLDDLTKQVADRGRFWRSFIEQSEGLLGQAGQVFGIGQPFAFLAQLGFFTRVQVSGFDFLQLVAQEIRAPLGVLFGLAQLVELAAQAGQLVICFAVIA